MKLATLRDGSRDGRLVVVSRDLRLCLAVPRIVSTLQAALDDWKRAEPLLKAVYDRLNQDGDQDAAELFFAEKCHSPLPRAYQWACGSAYLPWLELLHQSRGAEMPRELRSEPLMRQGGSDAFLDPCGAIRAASEDWGIDFAAQVAVVTDDVPMGVSPFHAQRHIRLLLLANDITYRNLLPDEMAKGFGLLQAKPGAAFAPVAVTPDELGAAWRTGRVHLPLVCKVDGKVIGSPNAGADMSFDFHALIAHAAKTRALCAGSIIGAGTVSSQDRSRGAACLAELRMLETLEQGKPRTAFLRFGDSVRIEMFDLNGATIFGEIDQFVEKYTGS